MPPTPRLLMSLSSWYHSWSFFLLHATFPRARATKYFYGILLCEVIAMVSSLSSAASERTKRTNERMMKKK